MKHVVYIQRRRDQDVEEVYQWLEAQGLGLVAHNQRFGPICLENMVPAAIRDHNFVFTHRFEFERATDALLFKLTWGGAA